MAPNAYIQLHEMQADQNPPPPPPYTPRTSTSCSFSGSCSNLPAPPTPTSSPIRRPPTTWPFRRQCHYPVPDLLPLPLPLPQGQGGAGSLPRGEDDEAANKKNPHSSRLHRRCCSTLPGSLAKIFILFLIAFSISFVIYSAVNDSLLEDARYAAAAARAGAVGVHGDHASGTDSVGPTATATATATPVSTSQPHLDGFGDTLEEELALADVDPLGLLLSDEKGKKRDMKPTETAAVYHVTGGIISPQLSGTTVPTWIDVDVDGNVDDAEKNRVLRSRFARRAAINPNGKHKSKSYRYPIDTTPGSPSGPSSEVGHEQCHNHDHHDLDSNHDQHQDYELKPRTPEEKAKEKSKGSEKRTYGDDKEEQEVHYHRPDLEAMHQAKSPLVKAIEETVLDSGKKVEGFHYWEHEDKHDNENHDDDNHDDEKHDGKHGDNREDKHDNHDNHEEKPDKSKRDWAKPQPTHTGVQETPTPGEMNLGVDYGTKGLNKIVGTIHMSDGRTYYPFGDHYKYRNHRREDNDNEENGWGTIYPYGGKLRFARRAEPTHAASAPTGNPTRSETTPQGEHTAKETAQAQTHASGSAAPTHKQPVSQSHEGHKEAVPTQSHTESQKGGHQSQAAGNPNPVSQIPDGQVQVRPPVPTHATHAVNESHEGHKQAAPTQSHAESHKDQGHNQTAAAGNPHPVSQIPDGQVQVRPPVPTHTTHAVNGNESHEGQKGHEDHNQAPAAVHTAAHTAAVHTSPAHTSAAASPSTPSKHPHAPPHSHGPVWPHGDGKDHMHPNDKEDDGKAKDKQNQNKENGKPKPINMKGNGSFHRRRSAVPGSKMGATHLNWANDVEHQDASLNDFVTRLIPRTDEGVETVECSNDADCGKHGHHRDIASGSPNASSGGHSGHSHGSVVSVSVSVSETETETEPKQEHEHEQEVQKHGDGDGDGHGEGYGDHKAAALRQNWWWNQALIRVLKWLSWMERIGGGGVDQHHAHGDHKKKGEKETEKKGEGRKGDEEKKGEKETKKKGEGEKKEKKKKETEKKETGDAEGKKEKEGAVKRSALKTVKPWTPHPSLKTTTPSSPDSATATATDADIDADADTDANTDADTDADDATVTLIVSNTIATATATATVTVTPTPVAAPSSSNDDAADTDNATDTSIVTVSATSTVTVTINTPVATPSSFPHDDTAVIIPSRFRHSVQPVHNRRDVAPDYNEPHREQMVMPGINEIHLTLEEGKPEIMDAKYDWWQFKTPPDLYYVSDQNSPFNPHKGRREALKKEAEEAARAKKAAEEHSKVFWHYFKKRPDAMDAGCRENSPDNEGHVWCLAPGGGETAYPWEKKADASEKDKKFWHYFKKRPDAMDSGCREDKPDGLGRVWCLEQGSGDTEYPDDRGY